MDIERQSIMDDVSISSRMKYLNTEDKKRIANFLIDYCFKDHKEVYTNGTILVPMFRVLDALESDGKDYCCG